MATTKMLLEVNYHSDTETGDSHVGEIDFGISGNLDEYIENYGKAGVDEIINTLAYLIYEVQRKLREDDQTPPTACAEYQN